MPHTVRNPFRLVRQGAERMLVIGPTRDAVLLEVVIVDPAGEPVIIHAMRCPPSS
jgi:hypothetical protein